MGKAVRAAKLSGAGIRVAEYLAETLGTEAKPVTHRAIMAGADAHKASVQLALRRLEERGFLVVDRAARPYTYRIAEAWIEGAA